MTPKEPACYRVVAPKEPYSFRYLTSTELSACDDAGLVDYTDSHRVTHLFREVSWSDVDNVIVPTVSAREGE